MLGLIPTVLAATTAPESQTINVRPGGQFVNLAPETLTVSDLVSGLITYALIIAAVIFFFMLVIGGIKWIMSGGDKGQTEGARNQITAALVGLVIVFSAWAIAQLVKAFFGVDIFDLTLPSASSIQ